jgi:hypothetical protein
MARRRATGAATSPFFLASMTRKGMGACIAVEGATTKAVFEAYVEEALSPSLGPGQVVVMDNLSSHKGQRVRELIEGRGCELLFLPPYSPDLNPIERAFAKLKAWPAQGAGQDLLGADRGDGSGARRDYRPGCLGLLPSLRIPCPGPTAMTDALS